MAEPKKYTGEELMAMRDALKVDNDIYLGVRDTCRYYFSPQQSNSRVFGNKVSEKLTPQNSIGIRSARDLVSGLYSNTINMSDEFFGYQTATKELYEKEAIKDWFAKCSEIAISKLAATNYGHSTQQTLREYVTVNTGVQYSEIDPVEKKLRFYDFMIDHCYIAEGKDGRIHTVFRDFELTAEQSYEKWGDECPKQVLDAYNQPQRRFEKFRYTHCVFPRLDYLKNKRKRRKRGRKLELPEEMRYASYYVFETNKEIVQVGGYKTCPYSVPRFERVNETPYGRGTSFDANGIMSQLEQLCYSISDGVELGVNPPIVKTPNSSDQFVDDITPGGTIYADPMYGPPTFYESNIDVQEGAMYKAMLEQEVKDLFYVDLFKMLEDHKNMTATEVAQRVAEKVQLLIPVISNIYDELYSVTLKRVFHLLLDAGFFPPMPVELEQAWDEEELRIHYTTKLDLKLAQLEIGQILKTINEIALVLTTKLENPDIEAVLDTDGIIKNLARMNGVSPDYIKTEKQTNAYYQAKAEAQQQAQAAEAAQAMIKPLDLQETIQQNSPLQMMGESASTAGLL